MSGYTLELQGLCTLQWVSRFAVFLAPQCHSSYDLMQSNPRRSLLYSADVHADDTAASSLSSGTARHDFVTMQLFVFRVQFSTQVAVSVGKQLSCMKCVKTTKAGIQERPAGASNLYTQLAA